MLKALKICGVSPSNLRQALPFTATILQGVEETGAKLASLEQRRNFAIESKDIVEKWDMWKKQGIEDDGFTERVTHSPDEAFTFSEKRREKETATEVFDIGTHRYNQAKELGESPATLVLKAHLERRRKESSSS